MLRRVAAGGLCRVSLRAGAPRVCSRACSARADSSALSPVQEPSSYLRMYLELSKFRLSGLVVMTTAAGHVMAQAPFDAVQFTAALGGTFLCAASANSFNQIIEVPRDAAMARTAKRPLPSGRISREHAIAFASTTGVAGVTTLALGTNPVTAGLGAATIGLYTLVYTPLKPRHYLNTWVGAVVGALPPVMGLTAAGSSPFCVEALVLGGSLFLWQIPHFLALAWMYRADYAQGGYQMLPLSDPTGDRTSAICLEYAGYLTLLPFVCWGAGLTSCMFVVESLAFNGLLLAASARFARNPQRGQAHARRLFLASLGYLPLFFFCLLLHQRRKPLAATSAVEELTADADALPSELEALGAEARERLRQRGRQICLHEQITNNNGGDGGRPRDVSEGAPLCPVAAADGLVTSTKALLKQQDQLQR